MISLKGGGRTIRADSAVRETVLVASASGPVGSIAQEYPERRLLHGQERDTVEHLQYFYIVPVREVISLDMQRNVCASSVSLVITIFLIAFAVQAGAEDIDKLMADLHAGGPAVRVSAIEELGKMKNDKAVNALVGIIEERDEDWRIQIRAIKALGAADNPKFVELLMDMLNDPFVTNDCPALKWNAALALGSFGKYPRVFDALTHALQDRDLYVREAVIQSLGQLGDGRAVPFLIAALNGRSFAIRASAIRALEKLDDPEAASYLKRIAQSDKDALLRNEALSALEKR
ncbi:MAG: HEAT repeat domain-containing protein [Nitrospirae bacterium]|nr:HEAT repeat domain-containing protein [Nitrospirota bacterium]